MESCLWSHVFRARTFSSFAGAWLNKLKIFICKVFPRTLMQVLLLLCFLSFSFFFQGLLHPLPVSLCHWRKLLFLRRRLFGDGERGETQENKRKIFSENRAEKNLFRNYELEESKALGRVNFLSISFFFVWLRRWDGLMAHRTMEMLFYWELDNKKWLNLEKGK